MVVCLCKGISDRKIRALVQDGATSVRDIIRTCQAGSDCGSCLCQLKELVAEARKESCASGGSEGSGA